MQRIITFIFCIILVCTLVINSCKNEPSLPDCAKSPLNELKISQVEDISPSPITERTGSASSNRDWGYSIQIKESKTLKIQASNNICVWLINPWQDKKLLDPNPVNLDVKGGYLIQVATKKGEQNYKITINLQPIQAQASPIPKPILPTLSSKLKPTETPIPVDKFTQDNAVALVNRWLSSKSQIFAPPYNLDLANQITTGKLAKDTNDGMYNLKQKGAKYTYGTSKVSEVISFKLEENQAQLQVKVVETVTYQEQEQQQNSNNNVYNVIYFLQKEKNIWKISDREID